MKLRVLRDELRNETYILDENGREIDPADLECNVEGCACRTCRDRYECNCPECKKEFSAVVSCESWREE